MLFITEFSVKHSSHVIITSDNYLTKTYGLIVKLIVPSLIKLCILTESKYTLDLSPDS